MDDPSAIAQSAVPRMGRPVLASLPFTAIDGPDWIGPALADDVLNELVRRGRFQGFSRQTTFAAIKDADALRTMGAEAVISGHLDDRCLCVRLSRPGMASETIKIPNVRMDRLQVIADEAVGHLLDLLGGPLDLPVPERPVLRSPTDPAAHAACLEAFELVWTFSADGNAKALAIARETCRSHPSDAVAQAMRAFLSVRGYRSGWIRDRDAVLADTKEALGAARANWNNDPRLLWTTAFAEAMLLRRYPVAAALVHRAAIEQPHVSPALTWGALFLTYDLDFDGALALARAALRISPDDPMRITQGFAGALAAIHGGRDRDALELCDMVLDHNPKMINALRIRAAALAHLGQTGEARHTMGRLLAIAPDETRTLIARVNPLREWAGFSRFLDGLASAGMP